MAHSRRLFLYFRLFNNVDTNVLYIKVQDGRRRQIHCAMAATHVPRSVLVMQVYA